MTASTLADIWGTEADWLACDADDHVAMFSTAGSGFAPQTYLDDIDVHHAAITAILSRPASTSAAFFPEIGPGLKNDWRLAAERGLYAFDNSPSGGDYSLVAAPIRVASLAELPVDLARLIATIRFRTLRFAEHKTLSNHDIERFLEE
jgi:hypothetical protein